MNLDKNKLKYVVPVLLMLAFGFLFLLFSAQSEGEEVTIEHTDEEAEEKENATEEQPVVDIEAASAVSVFICGEVSQPGVYELPAGARVCEAIAAAGGMTDVAAESFLNQAERLNDGQKVYVPSEEEAAGMEMNPVPDSTADTDQAEDSNLINLNTASREQLMTLPGIGESKAASILEYRNSNGNFSSIEEIKNITGIKEGTFQKLKDFICV